MLEIALEGKKKPKIDTSDDIIQCLPPELSDLNYPVRQKAHRYRWLYLLPYLLLYICGTLKYHMVKITINDPWISILSTILCYIVN